MTGSPEPRKHKSKSRFGRLSPWFGGILASVATIVAALASVVAAHQTSRVNELTIIVKQQRQQLAAAGRPSAQAGPAIRLRRGRGFHRRNLSVGIAADIGRW